MSALGLVCIGAGILTAWSGFDRTIVFDVFRSFVGAPVTSRTPTGATSVTPSSSPKSGFAPGGGAAGQGGGGGGGGSF